MQENCMEWSSGRVDWILSLGRGIQEDGKGCS
jgi:hypothetical protein